MVQASLEVAFQIKELVVAQVLVLGQEDYNLVKKLRDVFNKTESSHMDEVAAGEFQELFTSLFSITETKAFASKVVLSINTFSIEAEKDLQLLAVMVSDYFGMVATNFLLVCLLFLV